MDSYDGLLQAFDSLNERKRRNPDGLSKLEKARWRTMRCQIEEALSQQTRDPATDTREFIRVPVSLRISYRAGDTRREEYLTTLGENGLFIASSDPLPVGTRIELEGYPVSGGRPFVAGGEVVWSGKPEDKAGAGMGIKFVELLDEQKRLIHAIVDDTVRQGLLERRRHARIDTRIGIEIAHGGAGFSVMSHDLSIGGTFFFSDASLAVGSTVELRLVLPGGLPGEKTVATVVHKSVKISQGDSLGYGVSFGPSLDLEHVVRHYMRRRVTGELRHENDEPREHARLIRRTKLRFQAPNGFGTTDARDISCSGAFIQNRQPPPVGSQMDLSLVDPYTLKTLELSSRVVRVINPDPRRPGLIPGVGVTFENMSPGERDMIVELLCNLAELEIGP